MQELSDSEEFELTDGEESDEFVLESDSSGSDEDEDDSTERFDNGVEDFSNEDPVTATRRLQQGCHAGVASIDTLTALNDDLIAAVEVRTPSRPSRTPILMSSSCHHHVIIMSSSCHHRVQKQQRLRLPAVMVIHLEDTPRRRKLRAVAGTTVYTPRVSCTWRKSCASCGSFAPSSATR